MPVIAANGCPINVGRRSGTRPVLMLCNCSAPITACTRRSPFTQHFRLVRYDRRGTPSGVTKGPYSMAQLDAMRSWS
jgi:hypothetical protein